MVYQLSPYVIWLAKFRHTRKLRLNLQREDMEVRAGILQSFTCIFSFLLNYCSHLHFFFVQTINPHD